MQKKEEILQLLKNSKKGLEIYGIREIGLFGSSLRGDTTEKSDVDILLDLDDDSNITLFSLIMIEDELSAVLNKKVDLVIKSNLKPFISEQILSEVIYA